MASPGFSAIGGGGGGSVGSTSYKQVSPTSDPTFARLLEQIQAITPTSLPGINDIVSGGMNSPLLQLVLGPMLERLKAPQAQARQNLTESTRAAGGLRGSTYGQDMNKLLQNQALQGNDLMAQVLKEVLGTIMSGSLQSQQNSMLPGKSLTDLLRVIAPQTITGGSGGGDGGGWSSIPPSQGLNTKMSGTMTSPEDRDAQLRGFPSAEAMRFQQMTGAMGGSRAGSAPGVSNPSSTYTPYLDALSGGQGGGSYDLGTGSGTQYLSSGADNAQPAGYEGLTPTDFMQDVFPGGVVTEGWW